MGFGDVSLFVKIEFGLILATFLIQLIGFSVPFWFSQKISSVTYSGGLWEFCISTSLGKICSSYTTVLSWHSAVQALEILGFLCLLAAAILITLYMFMMSDKKILQLITSILCFCGFFFIFIGICVWAGEASSFLTHYSFAFAFCIIAFVIALVAGILGVLDYLGKGK